jgi:hypothetical protein
VTRVPGALLTDCADGVALVVMRRIDRRLIGKLQQASDDGLILRAGVAIGATFLNPRPSR